MRILALETSGRQGSAAAFAEGRVLVEHEVPPDERTARALAPTIRRVLAEAGWSPGDVERVAVTNGPGSFTGLRIGVTTAKAFAYGSGAAVQGVGTLECLAAQMPVEDDVRLWTVMDAQRQQLFAAEFAAADGKWRVREDCSIVEAEPWLAARGSGELLTGPGLARFRDALPASVRIAPESRWRPLAATVGQLAADREPTEDVWSLVPQYFRPSAAEERVTEPGNPS